MFRYRVWFDGVENKNWAIVRAANYADAEARVAALYGMATNLSAAPAEWYE